METHRSGRDWPTHKAKARQRRARALRRLATSGEPAEVEQQQAKAWTQ